MPILEAAKILVTGYHFNKVINSLHWAINQRLINFNNSLIEVLDLVFASTVLL